MGRVSAYKCDNCGDLNEDIENVVSISLSLVQVNDNINKEVGTKEFCNPTCVKEWLDKIGERDAI